MPKLMATNDDQVIEIPGPGNFQFSAVRIEDLGAAEYTLVTIVCDISGSVIHFANDLLVCIKTIVEACKKSPRAENLLVRLLLFNDQLFEIHGFKDLSTIDPNEYEELKPDNLTALYDAVYDGIGATIEYGKRLIQQDFECNGAVYILTDGMNNRGSMTPLTIKDKINTALQGEEIESLVTILVGLHAPGQPWEHEVKKSLDLFHKEAELTQFIDIGDATPQRLAKLANWVSESISSQSQALVDGAASQQLTF